MKRAPLFLFVVFWLGYVSCGISAEPAEPLLRELPPGILVVSSVEIPSAQTEAIGQRFGGKISRLTNSAIQVYGSQIRINVVTAPDEANAETIHAAFLRTKPYPFCLRQGNAIIEYVINSSDPSLALKTSWELGFLDKPEKVRYRVTVDLAAVDTADYMAVNPLFNQFLAVQGGANQDAVRQIGELSKKFVFGRSVILRNPAIGNGAEYHCASEPASKHETGAVSVYSFNQLPTRQNIPYVIASMEVTVDDTGLCKTAAAPPLNLTAATPFWPADDPSMKALAEQITTGKNGNDEKILAILEWLAPGKNLQYSGQTGSRWGVKQVFEQKFGHCWDFSDCFITLARAAGIPTRQVGGWLYGSSGHIWAEYYREGAGWQQVDPTGGGMLVCGIYHIPYFTSEDGDMHYLYLSMPGIEIIRAD